MVTVKMFYEKLAWGTGVPLSGPHVQVGKLHKAALFAGIRLSRSYAPHRRLALVPKALHTPAETVSLLGDVKGRKSVTMSVVQFGQKQAAQFVKLGSFVQLSKNSEALYQAYKPVQGHMIGSAMKLPIVPKQEKSFAPVKPPEAERKIDAVVPQMQQHMAPVSSATEGQSLANALEWNRSVHQQMIDKYHVRDKGSEAAAKDENGGRGVGTQQERLVSHKQNFEDMLDAYFLRQSRLPPAGGTGVNPKLSPLWAGLKIPM